MAALDYIKRQTGALHALALAALVIALYAGTLGYPWQYDDGLHIVRNPATREARAVFDHAYGKGLGVEPIMARIHQARPLSYLSFALDRELYGLTPGPWRAENIALHAGTAMVLYALLCLILEQTSGEWSPQARARTALLGAAAFALHPLATESVIYVTQRTNLLASFFYLSALASYAAWRKHGRAPYYALALLSVLGAMLSKEPGFTAPLALVLMEFALYGPEGKGLRQRLLGLAPFLAMMALLPLRLIMFAMGQGKAGLLEAIASQSALMPEATRLQYLATQSIVVVKYLGLLLWPSGQNVDHYYQPVASVLSTPVLLCFLILSALLAAALLGLLRKWGPEGMPLRAAALLLGYFFLALSVESTVFPLKEMMVEYRTYLPGAFFLSALAVLASLALQRVAALQGLRVVALVGLVFVLAWPMGLAGASYIRGLAWQSTASLWIDSLEKNPDNPRAMNNIATEYMRLGKERAALELLERSVRISDYEVSWKNLLLLYTRAGRYQEAEKGYRKLLAEPTPNPDLYAGYGLLALKTDRPALAVALYGRFLSFRPGQREVLRDRARAYRMLGNIPAAEADEAAAKVASGWKE